MSGKGLLPKLRFPEFCDGSPWEERPLGQLGQFYRGLTYAADDVAENGLLVLRSSNIQNGNLVLDSDLVHVRKDCPKELLLKPEDTAICMSNGSKALVGKSARYRGGGPERITVGAFCSIFRPANTFANLVFATQQYGDFVALGIAGGNINNLKNSDLERLRFAIPTLPAEQRKIAKCLTSLDELIAAEGRRLEALRKWKKGLLQNLFPTSSGSEKSEGRSEKTADGEPFSLPNSQFSPLIPRLRFPEFREAGEWQEEPLGDLVRFQSGGTPSKAEQRFWNGSMPWVTAKDMKPFLLEDTEDHITTDATEDGAKQVPAGTTLILTRGMTLLKDLPICIVQRPMSFNQDVKALRPLGELNELFLAYLLFSKKPLVLKMVDVAGHGTGRLDTDKLRALVLTLPNGKEQNRIASCLSSLDTLIAEQAKKLATLKTHKQGLMQGLFPSEK